QGPNRIRHFLWLSSHKKLLTNHKRLRRHLTRDNSYPLYEHSIKDMEHILRCCPLAADWKSLIPSTQLRTFLTLE
ncbi:Putative ribonuclease H protein At1g65750, partial [Linum perenne]